jgi:hypothetical protein
MPSAKLNTIPDVAITEEEIAVYLREMGRLYRVLMFETRIYTGPSKTAIFEVRLYGTRPTSGHLTDFRGFYVPYPTESAPDATVAQYRAVIRACGQMDHLCDDLRVPRLFADAEL